MTRPAGSGAGSTRAWAEHLGGTKVRFHWPCGHVRTKDYGKGPIARRVPEFWLRRVCRVGGYWSIGQGGVHVGLCETCSKRERK